MKKQFLLLALGLAGILLACGQLARASLAPAPNDIEDSLPAWSSDGSRVAFQRAAPSLQHVVTMKPSGKDLYVASQSGLFRGFVPGGGSPPYMLVQQGDTTILTIGGRFAGPAAEFHGTDAAAAPDGVRVAYVRGGTLYVARLDAVRLNTFPIPVPPETAIAEGITQPAADVVGPVWSKDGTHIVVATLQGLLVVNADGSGLHIVPSVGSNPSLDPAGTTIAYEHLVGSHYQVWLVRTDGSDGHELLGEKGANYRFPTFSTASAELAFISDRQHVRGGATQYQYALYTRDAGSGAIRKLLDDVHPYSPPAWDPNGPWLAAAAGKECLRWGIYEIPSGGGSAPRRSNICRYDGGSGVDTIHGSPYFDLINGLGGDDHLFGFWGNDKILGEDGNDVIVGDAGNDVLFGGPGNDVIFGGAGNDTIIPGNGADRIDCGAGTDTVEGAGPLDHIAKNCEHVRR